MSCLLHCSDAHFTCMLHLLICTYLESLDIFMIFLDKHCFCPCFCSDAFILHCIACHLITHVYCCLFTSLSYSICVWFTCSSAYASTLFQFTHCLLTIVRVMSIIIWFTVTYCFCNICCLIVMSWNYFVHVCNGPLSFAIFNFEVLVHCLHFHFFCIWLYA